MEENKNVLTLTNTNDYEYFKIPLHKTYIIRKLTAFEPREVTLFKLLFEGKCKNFSHSDPNMIFIELKEGEYEIFNTGPVKTNLEYSIELQSIKGIRSIINQTNRYTADGMETFDSDEKLQCKISNEKKCIYWFSRRELKTHMFVFEDKQYLFKLFQLNKNNRREYYFDFSDNVMCIDVYNKFLYTLKEYYPGTELFTVKDEKESQVFKAIFIKNQVCTAVEGLFILDFENCSAGNNDRKATVKKLVNNKYEYRIEIEKTPNNDKDVIQRIYQSNTKFEIFFHKNPNTFTYFQHSFEFVHPQVFKVHNKLVYILKFEKPYEDVFLGFLCSQSIKFSFITTNIIAIYPQSIMNSISNNLITLNLFGAKRIYNQKCEVDENRICYFPAGKKALLDDIQKRYPVTESINGGFQFQLEYDYPRIILLESFSIYTEKKEVVNSKRKIDEVIEQNTSASKRSEIDDEETE